MRRLAVAVVLLLAACATTSPPPPPPPPAQCPTDIAHCPDIGCSAAGSFDPNLNRQKNIVSNAATQGPATIETLADMTALHNPPKAFKKGDTREVLKGEGKKVSVVAFIIAAKAETSGESCNCELQTPAETDNHLVLVSPETIAKFPLPGNVFHNRELESITAEFTPRVRKAGHPNFTKATMDPLINATAQQALLVRVTGLLMFDSEHFFIHPLVRVNNWEIHPVLKMEFCKTGNDCTADSDTGWKSID